MIPVRAGTWRRIGVGLAVLAAALLVLRLSPAPTRTSTPATGPTTGGEAGAPPMVAIAGDSTGAAMVRNAFNAAAGHERILALLSPT